MRSPSNDTPGPPEDSIPRSAPYLMHLRLSARVLECNQRVRLVGDGAGVEISTDGASSVHVHNEPVTLALDEVADEPTEQAERVLRRWRALRHIVDVDVVMVRADGGIAAGGRRVEITGRDGAVLRWREPRAGLTVPAGE